MLYDPVNTDRSCDRTLWEPFIGRIVDVDHVYGQHAAQLKLTSSLRGVGRRRGEHMPLTEDIKWRISPTSDLGEL